MANFSFDIVSDYDKAELNNVFDQTQREITSRYDFKGTSAAVEWLNDDQLRFVLNEGRKRQIRRMCELVGLRVVGLKRVRMGKVRLGDLPLGKWRYLRDSEKF